MKSTKKPKVSIVVPSFNSDEKKITECLTSLFKLDYKDKEIIIVNNGSTNGVPAKIKKKFPKIRLVNSKKNLGCSGGHNLGIKNSKGGVIFRCDDDITVEKDFLDKMVKVLMSDEKIGAVSPKIMYYVKPDTIRTVGFKMNMLTTKAKIIGVDEKDEGQYDNVKRDLEFCSGCGVMFKKGLVKGFPEDYLVYFEDFDWCKMMRDKGYKIRFVPGAKLWHNMNLDGTRSPFVIYNNMKGKIIFMKRHGKNFPLFSAIFLGLYTPVNLIKFLFKGRLDLVKPYFRALKDGFSYKRPVKL